MGDDTKPLMHKLGDLKEHASYGRIMFETGITLGRLEAMPSNRGADATEEMARWRGFMDGLNIKRDTRESLAESILSEADRMRTERMRG